MIETVRWLHISDFHLKADGNKWSQDVVLNALYEDVRQNVTEPINFIVATGDLAFSGRKEEYELVENFFDDLRSVLEIDRSRIFCVPGNHDNDLRRQKLACAGARSTLDGPSQVDAFFADEAERGQLLERQNAYCDFNDSYTIDRKDTDVLGNLAYVSEITVGSFRLGILGINSAWICLSGENDRGTTVVGEKQVIDTVATLRNTHRPSFVVGLMHHPFDWIGEFERSIVESRLIEACDVLHRGHLHEQETRITELFGKRCMILAAGATYATRQFQNCYSIVTLEIPKSTCNVSVREYSPTVGKFEDGRSETTDIRFRPSVDVSAKQIVESIIEVAPEFDHIKHYLAALLSGHKHEVPIQTSPEPVFGSPAVLVQSENPELIDPTNAYLEISNLINAFSGAQSVSETIRNCKSRLETYGRMLVRLAKEYPKIDARLSQLDQESKSLITPSTEVGTFGNSLALLEELCEQQDWTSLKETAERLVESENASVQAVANRMLVYSLAHSSDSSDRDDALSKLLLMLQSNSNDIEIYAHTIRLLLDAEMHERAKELILDGIERFRQHGVLYELGLEIVSSTGDRLFRDQLSAASTDRMSK